MLKRHTRATYNCMAAEKSVNAGLACGLGCTPALSVTHSNTPAAVASFAFNNSASKRRV